MPVVILRHATPADAPAIAALHVAVWRATYRGIATREAFEKLDEQARFARWTEMLGRPATHSVTVLAEAAGELAGFATLAGSSEQVFAGRPEVKFLYVAMTHREQGVGRRLMAAMAAEARRRGATGLALGVVTANAPALAFYARLGGREIGRYTDPGPLWRSENIALAWDDLDRLG